MPRDAALGRCCVLGSLLSAMLFACSTPLWAQAPVVDPQVSPAAAGLPVAGPPAPAPGLGHGALLSAISSAHAAHKARFYASPLGKLLVNMRKQLSFLTGGMVQSDSPHAAKYQGAAGGPPPSPAMGAAQKIKADAKQAAERREAVRFLGTVDCHYYPEAEQALIGALRCDRSECVRLEAALALGKGCCCTKKTVEALKIAVSGSQRDGNPGETSLRVRTAAFEALQNCLINHGATSMSSSAPAKRPEYPAAPLAPQPEAPPSSLTPPAGTSPAPQPGGVDTGASAPNFEYYGRVDGRPWPQIVSEARQLVDQANLPQQPSVGGYATGRRNLYSLWVRSATPEEGFAPWLTRGPTPAGDPGGAGNLAAGNVAGRGPAASPPYGSAGSPPAVGSVSQRPSYPAPAAGPEQYRQDASVYMPRYTPVRRTPPVAGDARPVDYQRAAP